MPRRVPNPGARYLTRGFRALRREVAGPALPEDVREALAASRTALENHVGGEPSETQLRLIESVLILDLLIATSLAVVQELGSVSPKTHHTRPITRDLASLLEKRRRFLVDLGFDRRARRVDPMEALRKRVEEGNAIVEARLRGTAPEPPAHEHAPAGAEDFSEDR